MIREGGCKGGEVHTIVLYSLFRVTRKIAKKLVIME